MGDGKPLQKRRFERFEAEKPGVDCRICGQERGCIRNISIGGAAVCSEGYVEVGSKCILGVNTTGKSFSILAEVIWADESGPTGCRLSKLPVSMGLKFSEDTLEQSKDLVFTLLNCS